MISADSGIAPASGALAAHDAPEWCSRWAGIGAHARPESLLTIDRNGCSRSAGIRTGDVIAAIFYLKAQRPKFRDRLNIDIEQVKSEIQERVAQLGVTPRLLARAIPALTE